MKNEKVNIRPYVKQFYKGNAGYFLLAICEVLFTTICSLAVAWLLQQLLDLIGGKNVNYDLMQLTLIACATLALSGLGYFISYHSKPKFITKGISQYKKHLFNQLTKKNISSFLTENSSVYLSALTNDIAVIEQGYLFNTFTILENVLFFTCALGLMLLYNPLLTAVAIGFSLLPLIAALLTGNKMATEEKKASQKNVEYTSTIKDCLSGFSVVKSFKAEAQMLNLFKSNLKELASAQSKKHKLKILIESLCLLAGYIAQFGVFVFGAYLALNDKGITAGTIILFVQLMNYVLNPIGILPTAIAERMAAKELVKKIALALDTNVTGEKRTRLTDLNESIRLKDLSFCYEKDKKALSNVNYTFELGKKYAIVGASGSGKSTLLSLLMASYPNYEGNIFYDKKELRNIDADSLYELQGIIQQNVFLFNTSVINNVTMFSDFNKEDIANALALSGLTDFIKEKGEDYLCGENGNALSGGEKQRISIARSLLKNYRILLVDEATAALDAETAFQISSAILDLKEQTAIVVTHALEESLLKRYDQIICMKNGEIAESGSFEELIDKKEYFYSLYTISQ